MAIERTNVVDAVGLDRITGDVVPTIVDAMDWDVNGPHLQLLQEKLNTYITFAESGQLIESYPSAAGRRIRIDVIFRFEPSERAIQLLEAGRVVTEQLPAALSWQVSS